MDQELKEYIKSLIPEGYPDGRELVKEGKDMAKDIPWNKSRFLEETGYESYIDYRRDNLKKGKQTYQLLMGLSTLEEELDGIRQIYEFAERTGFEVRSVQAIASLLVGLDPEYWDGVPKMTSYTMEKEEDWLAHTEIAPIAVCWLDYHLASPNNLAQTKYALKAGTSRLGLFSTFVWEYPGYYDDKKRFSDMCRSMGILAAKKDQGMECITYAEDGIPGAFLDVASYVGYAMIEHHIIEDLCGARMTFACGNLMSEIVPRIALTLALEKLFGRPDYPFTTYYNGSTTEQWDHDLETNYGLQASEMLIQSVINLKYDLPIVISPVSITEAIRVPTLDELLNIVKCGIGVERKAKEWLEIIDFTKFETMRDLLVEKGVAFYEKAMNCFKESGVDIEDPLEMIMVLKGFDPVRLEREFHPSNDEFGEFKPYVPTKLAIEVKELKETIVEELKNKGYTDAIKGKKIVCVSGDTHSYGLMLIDLIWSDMGAVVINGGTNMEPTFTIDLADEENTDIVCVSVHNGQSLDYAKQLAKYANRNDKKYRLLMGGKLNGMLPGNTEPVDVSDLINEMGISATNDFEEQVKFMIR